MSPQLEPVAELETLKSDAKSPGFSRGGESSKRSPSSTPRKEDDFEGNHSPNHKKSLFVKMKEKAKKLQRSLSNKKKQGEDGDSLSSPSLSLDSHKAGEVEEEDPEYFGAPMYESEMAPLEIKETARQHPRADPVIPENHVLSVPTKTDTEQEQQEPIGSDKTMTDNLALTDEKGTSFGSPHKTIVETMSEKLAPAYAKVSDVTQSITSKIQGLAVSSSTDSGTENLVGSENKVWDKGVSVKEYIMNKFEPGEDDRALSRAITKAISPRKASGYGDMIERVKSTESDLSSVQRVPVSINKYEIAEEENHGKILQTN